jgi:hypothetical protein
MHCPLKLMAMILSRKWFVGQPQSPAATTRIPGREDASK